MLGKSRNDLNNYKYNNAIYYFVFDREAKYIALLYLDLFKPLRLFLPHYLRSCSSDTDRSRTTLGHTTTQLTALQAKEVFFQGSVEKKQVGYSVVWFKEIMSLCTATEAYSTELSSFPLKDYSKILNVNGPKDTLWLWCRKRTNYLWEHLILLPPVYDS